MPTVDIHEDPLNARQSFPPEGIRVLADTIEERWNAGLPGLLYPIVVRPRKEGGFLLIDGARRLRAHHLLGLKYIDVEVQDLDDRAAAVAAALANLQRSDLTMYEQARAYQRLLDLGLQKKQVQDRVGISFNTLKARLQLLDLPEAVARQVGVQGFSLEHAQLLLPWKQNEAILGVAIEAILPKAGEEAETVEEARSRILGILVEKKLVLDVDQAAGLQDAHGDQATEKRQEELRKATAAQEFQAGHGRTAHLAIVTPSVTKLVAQARKTGKEIPPKREPTAPIREPAEDAKEREERDAMEHQADHRAERLLMEALAEARSKITPTVAAIVLFEYFEDAAAIEAVLPGLKVQTDGDFERKSAIKILGKLSLEEMLRTRVVLQLASASHFDPDAQEAIAFLTGKKAVDFLSLAKAQIRQETKAQAKEKKTSKPTPSKPKVSPSAQKARPKSTHKKGAK